jgi:hypothetical protein
MTDRLHEAGLKLAGNTRPLTPTELMLAHNAREAAINATRAYEGVVNLLCQVAAGRQQEAANDA